MGALRPIIVLFVGLLLGGSQDPNQAVALDPDMIAGPWESASATGIDGIFFQILTSYKAPAADQQIAFQTIDIRVYHRQDLREKWGWFSTQFQARPDGYNAQDDESLILFDGQRLRVHFTDTTTSDLKPFDLDITFSTTTQSWTGTWSRRGQDNTVVLERPTPKSGTTPNGFVGDWKGETEHPYDTQGSLHIRQSQDGILSAWLDRKSSGGGDQRNGELLRVYFVTGAGLTLETAGIGPPHDYHATISGDQEVITGSWSDAGGRLNAPDKFRRIS
jgi:hypothetical protein